MRRLTEFLAGLLFGVGLVISGMTQPSKVIGFLDIGGRWDPSLAFVMGGAIAIGYFGFKLTARRAQAVLAPDFHWPKQQVIDKALIGGSFLFGVGWGIAGICPGPAIVNLTTGQPKAVMFVIAMIVGMGLQQFFTRSETQET